MSNSVADAIVSQLVHFGVKRVYGVPGDSINPLVDAIRRNPALRFIQVRHEEGGALAASFEAKFTGSLAAVLGTSGPGSVHLLNGLYDAKLEHAPVIALTGQVRTESIGLDSPQEVNLLKLYDDVSVFSSQVTNPASASRMAYLACRTALIERGVSHLVLPVDVLKSGCDESEEFPSAIPVPKFTFDPKPVEELIDRSSRPVILVGRGAYGSSEKLDRFAERIGAPVVYSLNGKGALPEDDPKVMGGIGLLGSKPSSAAMSKADLLLILGSSFPFTEFLPKGIPVIQVDIVPEHIGKRVGVTLGVVSNLEGFFSSVQPREKTEKFYRELEPVKKAWTAELESREKARENPIPPQAVVREVCELLPRDSVVVCDVGLVTLWCAQNLRLKAPYRFYTSSWLGSMGSGVAGAIGVSFATERPVVALVGDGGFAMTMMEVLTAVKYARPIKVVVFNNSKLGLIKIEQEMMGFPEFGTELHNPDFARLAESMGAKGVRIDRVEDLRGALEELMAQAGPAVLDVVVSADEVPASPV